MEDLATRLRRLERPVAVALIGAGSAGKGITYQSLITPGVNIVALADVRIERAIACAEEFDRAFKVVDTQAGVDEAVRDGILAVCENGALCAAAAGADVCLDASNALAEAPRLALAALDTGKHLVMMNAEADLIFGPYFMTLADRRGLVYTSCDGDQPAVIKRLADELSLWGFELVMAGNIKGFLDRYANPTTIVPEAQKRGLDPKMCASYTDGSKIAIEMALVANGLGLRTPVPGMLGPRADDLYDVFTLFDFADLWKGRQGVVDYVIGPRPKGGVFAIGFSDHPFQKFMLDWFPSDLGPGPYYLFYRPYHLIHVEALRTAAEAALDRTSLLAPRFGFRTNVYAYAKRHLRAGERLDGIGGFSCYGLIENAADNSARPGLPICLAEDIVLVRDVFKDGKIFWDDIRAESGRPDFRTFELASDASLKLAGGSSRP
jgi:predicted homoserine dehydrogenase-like protein